jgi:2-keto-4-pentenoate hydratase
MLMTDTFDAEPLANLFVAAHRDHQPVPADRIAAEPKSVEEAYAVQARVMGQIGPAGGFKTGRPDIRLPSIMAPIPACNIRLSPARFEADEMRLVGVEIEIAFRIDSALPEAGLVDYEERLRQAVSVVPVIEMVDTRVAEHGNAGDMLKLSDNQFGFGLVVGKPIKQFRDLNLINPGIVFTVDGKQTGPTAGQIPGERDAFEVLKDFLEVVGDHCGGIAPGHYVTTGALSGLHWATHGCEVAGTVEGLGDVLVTVG